MNTKRWTCPKCKAPSLSEFNTSEGVIVDFCDLCSGIWFDKNELAQYIELSIDIPEFSEMKQKAVKTDLVCPKCGLNLEELPFSSKTHILVDRCDGCGGIFFDAGEIIEAERVSALLESTEDRMGHVLKRLTDEEFRPVT